MCIISGYIHQFIGLCLIPLDHWEVPLEGNRIVYVSPPLYLYEMCGCRDMVMNWKSRGHAQIFINITGTKGAVIFRVNIITPCVDKNYYLTRHYKVRINQWKSNWKYPKLLSQLMKKRGLKALGTCIHDRKDYDLINGS